MFPIYQCATCVVCTHGHRVPLNWHRNEHISLQNQRREVYYVTSCVLSSNINIQN